MTHDDAVMIRWLRVNEGRERAISMAMFLGYSLDVVMVWVVR